jgi:hypothetical protein
MASLTRTEIKTLIRQWSDDTNGTYFDDTALNPFIRMAEIEVQKQLIQAGEMYYEKCQQTTLVTNQWDYILPSDFLKIHRLELVLSGSGVNEDRKLLSKVTMNQQGMLGNAAGTPVAYIIKKNRITLFPTPDSAKTLRMFYSYRLTPMANDSDTPDVPEEYQEYIAILACFDCFIKDDRAPNNLEAKKQQYLDMLKKASENRDESQGRMVVALDGGETGEWF